MKALSWGNPCNQQHALFNAIFQSLAAGAPQQQPRRLPFGVAIDEVHQTLGCCSLLQEYRQSAWPDSRVAFHRLLIYHGYVEQVVAD